jgi:hypothetical protein
MSSKNRYCSSQSPPFGVHDAAATADIRFNTTRNGRTGLSIFLKYCKIFAGLSSGHGGQ